mmetsp:Transcript_8996/g.26143  ORF Transcript_8996/g.26143 Transcript_8996/m.26143 type:complete len:244 (+) Transcript_8996:2703-3434(+)
MGTTSGSTWMRRRTGCSCTTLPVRGLISMWLSGLLWPRDKISGPRRRILRLGRGDWRRRRARGLYYLRKKVMTSMTTTTTRRRWSARGRRWRWRRSGNAKGGPTPSRGRFASWDRRRRSGWRVATRTRTSVSSTERQGKEFTTIPGSPRIRTCRMCAAGSSNASTRCGPPFTLVQVSWKRGIRPRKARAARRPGKRRSNACSRTPRLLSGTCRRRFCGPRSSGQRRTSRPTPSWCTRPTLCIV